MYLTNKQLRIVFELIISGAMIVGMASFLIEPGSDRLFFLFFGKGFLLLLVMRGHRFDGPDPALDTIANKAEISEAAQSFLYIGLMVGYVFITVARFVDAILPALVQAFG